MFTTYTHRVPHVQHNARHLHKQLNNDTYNNNDQQQTQPISLAGDTQRECLMKETTSLDKFSILDNSDCSDYCIEQGEMTFDDDNHDIQLLYSKNERNVNSGGKRSCHKRMWNGCVITVIENGNCVKEYECPKDGDSHVINEMLRKDKVSLMKNKMLQFVDLTEHERVNMSLKGRDRNATKDKKDHWLSLLSRERTANIAYVSNSKRNKNKLKTQLALQFEYSQVKPKKRNKGVNTAVVPLCAEIGTNTHVHETAEKGINVNIANDYSTPNKQSKRSINDKQHYYMQTQVYHSNTDQRSLLEHSSSPSEHTLERDSELRNAKQHKPSLYVIPKEETDILNKSITNCISFNDSFSKDKGIHKDGIAMRSRAMLFRKKCKHYYECQQHS